MKEIIFKLILYFSGGLKFTRNININLIDFAIKCQINFGFHDYFFVFSFVGFILSDWYAWKVFLQNRYEKMCLEIVKLVSHLYTYLSISHK